MDPMEVGRTDQVEHNIETSEHPPIKQPSRRIPFLLHPKVETSIQEMLSQGVVKESSSSWASLIVLVSKPDGTTVNC